MSAQTLDEPRVSEAPAGEKSTHIWNPKDCAPGRYLCGKRMSASRREGILGPWCPLCVAIRNGELPT